MATCDEELDDLLKRCSPNERGLAELALGNLERGENLPAVNANIGRLQTKHPELTLELARRAHAAYPANIHFVTRYASLLRHARKPEDALAVLGAYSASLDMDNELSPKQRIMFATLHAAVHRDIGNYLASRDILERLPIDGLPNDRTWQQPRTALAETYYLLGDFARAARLVDDLPQREWTLDLRKARARVYVEVGDAKGAQRVLAPVRKDPSVQELLEKLTQSTPTGEADALQVYTDSLFVPPAYENLRADLRRFHEDASFDRSVL